LIAFCIIYSFDVSISLPISFKMLLLLMIVLRCFVLSLLATLSGADNFAVCKPAA